MMDMYRGMNRHFIPTGYELSEFAKVFDSNRKGNVSSNDIYETAKRMFIADDKKK